MEYLSRILKEVGEKREFKFYEKCNKIEINHLCFADDLLLFCNGDYVSMGLMLQGLKLFLATSGLFPNEDKSAIYCSGMKEEEV